MKRNKLIGYLGGCGTDYCGGVEGYFCVKCKIYTSKCLCGFNNKNCHCANDVYWAGKGERKKLLEKING